MITFQNAELSMLLLVVHVTDAFGMGRSPVEGSILRAVPRSVSTPYIRSHSRFKCGAGGGISYATQYLDIM